MSPLTSPRTALNSRPARRTRDQRGLVLSSPLALISAGAVLLLGAAFLITDPQAPTTVTLVAAPQGSEPPTVLEAIVEPEPEISRADTFVVVFNNSGITGLAAETAARLTGAGWNVVGDDNWYGTIPSNTVYFPERLEAAAQLLAEDLGVDRVMPAVEPMQMDRLTLILTGPVG